MWEFTDGELNMSNQRNVRISAEAHALLAEKAEDYNATQKDIASEAIFLMFKEKTRNMAITGVALIVGSLTGFLCGYFIGAI